MERKNVPMCRNLLLKKISSWDGVCHSLERAIAEASFTERPGRDASARDDSRLEFYSRNYGGEWRPWSKLPRQDARD